MNDVSTIYKGQIAYLQEGKSHGVIEYQDNNERKSILFLRNIKEQVAFKKQNLQKDIHTFRNGDVVQFQIKQSDKDSTKFIAYYVLYIKNEAVDALLNLAKTSNKFIGFLKKIEEDYFIKEVTTYLFIPVMFSNWEYLPNDDLINKKISFKLINQEKINKLSAKLLDTTYTDEIQTLKWHLDEQRPLIATIMKFNPASVSVSLLDGQFKGKLPLSENVNETTFSIGDTIKVTVDSIDKNIIDLKRI